MLLLGEVGQALAEALGALELGESFMAVEVVAAGVRPGVGGEKQARSGAQRDGGLGGEFAAVAAILLAGVVGLLFEVTELQAALVLAGGEFDAGLTRGVVEDELVEAGAAVPACRELLALHPREAGPVGVFARFAGKPGGGVGRG